MNTRDLEYFISLTEIKSFSKVAHEFDVSQPTITFALQRLEKEMNSKLIVRHRNQELVVTDSGEQLLVHAKAVMRHCHLAHEEIANLREKKLMLGLPPVIENNYFSPVARQLKQAGLLNKIETSENGSKTTLKQLTDGEIDLALLGSIDPLSEPNLIAEEFDRRPFAIYVAKDHPLAKKGGVHFADLKGEDFLLFKSGFIHNNAFNTMAKRNHFRPRVVFRSNGLQTLLSMIAEGVGIGFFSTVIAAHRDDVVKVELLDEAVPEFVASLVYRDSHRFNDLQTEVLRGIRQALDIPEVGGTNERDRLH